MSPTLYAVSNALLIDRDIYRAIWRKSVALGLTPREWWLALDLIDQYSGDIFWPGRAKNDLPDLSFTPDAFAKWMSRFLAAAPAESCAPHCYLTRAASLDRIRMIDLYLKIKAVSGPAELEAATASAD